MNALERAQAKSQQMTDLKAAILPLEENQTIHLPIDESIVLTLDDIKMYLNTVSKSIKRYAVFFNCDKFSIIRLADNMDLRSVYEDELKPKKEKANELPAPAPLQAAPNAIDPIELDKTQPYKPVKAPKGFQLAEDYMRDRE